MLNSLASNFKNNPLHFIGVFVLGCMVSWVLVSILQIAPRDKYIGKLKIQTGIHESKINSLTNMQERSESDSNEYEINNKRQDKENHELRLSKNILREIKASYETKTKLLEILVKGGYIDEETQEFVQVDKSLITEIETHITQLKEQIQELETRLSNVKK